MYCILYMCMCVHTCICVMRAMCYACICVMCICVMRAVRPGERHQTLAQVPLLLPPATIIRDINYTDIVPGQPNTQSVRCAVRLCARNTGVFAYTRALTSAPVRTKPVTQDRTVCDKLLFANHLSTDYPNLKSCSGLLFTR